MFQKILVVLSQSETSKSALETAVELAHLFQASLWVLVVEKHLPRYPATIGEVEEAREVAEQAAHALVSHAYLRALQAGVPFQSEIRAGLAARTILNVASTGHFDLLVLGTASSKTMLHVTRNAPCSVLLVR